MTAHSLKLANTGVRSQLEIIL